MPNRAGEKRRVSIEDERASKRIHVEEPQPQLQSQYTRSGESPRGLGTEIINMILDLLNHDSPHSMSSVALVSKFFYNAARYSQSKVLYLDVSNDAYDIRQRMNYLVIRGLLPAIRRLVIKQSNDLAPGQSSVFKYLKTIPGLREVEWEVYSGTVPPQVVRALRGRQGIQLHTVIIPQSHKPQNSLSEQVAHLVGCKNLRSLRLICSDHSDNFRRSFSMAVKPVLLSCPNLSNVSINISVPKGGCVMPSPARHYTGFGFVKGECPPPLEELDLGEYEWGFELTSQETAPNQHFGGPYVGYPGKGTEFNYWVNTFDWSRLKRLRSDISNIHFLNALAPKLAALEEVSVAGSWIKEVHQGFYQNVRASLKIIAVDSISCAGIHGLLKHGQSLESLTIHQNEMKSWAVDTATAEDLVQLREGCPRLRELALDVARDGVWPYEKLDILANFPNLRQLTLWFELGHFNDDTIQPVVKFSAARHLYEYIQSRRPQGMPLLEKITIISGCPRGIGYGYPGPNAFWPRENSTSFICAVADRDDDRAKGMFSVQCTKLTRQQNDALERIEQGDANIDEDVHQYLANRDFTLALNGPHRAPEPQWNL